MGKGSFYYYEKLAQQTQEFDARKPGEPPGWWCGKGVEILFAEYDSIPRSVFRKVFQGFHPFTNAPLVRNAGNDNRVPGWDLTFSTPKSVSIVFALSSESTKNQLLEAHRIACKNAISYLEKSIGQRFLVHAYDHATNRNRDPMLHTHCLVMNVGVSPEGKTRALHSRPLYQHKMAAGAMYRAELSARLQEMGFSLKREQSWFEIKGFSRHRGPYKGLMNAWSSRRREIEAHKPATAREAQTIAYKTRSQKGVLPSWQGLTRSWVEESRSHGVVIGGEKSHDVFEKLREPLEKSHSFLEKWHEWRTLRQAIKIIPPFTSHFSRTTFERFVAESAQTRPLGSVDAQRLAERYLSSRHVIRLPSTSDIPPPHHELPIPQYVLTRHYRLERKLIKSAKKLSTKRFRMISFQSARIPRSINKKLTLDQRHAAKRLLIDNRRLVTLHGIPCSGKTQTLRAVKAAYIKAGQHVVWATPTRTDRSRSQSWLSAQIRGSLETHTSINGLLWRERKGCSALNEKSVVLVDDAHQISGVQMRDLLSVVQKRGAKIVLSGDYKLGQGTVHQGAFYAINRRCAAAVELKESPLRERQEQKWDRICSVASRKLAPEIMQENFREYKASNRAEEELLRERAEKDLLETWSVEGGIAAPEKHLILAAASSDVSALNAAVQRRRQDAQSVGRVGIRLQGDERLYRGDRIRISQSCRRNDVAKGQLGTVLSIQPQLKLAVVKLDTGKKRVLNLWSFKGVELGYAVRFSQSAHLSPQHSYALLKGGGRIKAISALGRAVENAQVFYYGNNPRPDRSLEYGNIPTFSIDIEHARER